MPRDTDDTAMPEAMPGLAQGTLGYRILGTARAYHATAARTLAHDSGVPGLTASRLMVLQALADGTPRSGADIGRCLMITPQSAAYAVGALDELGWIARSPGKGRHVGNAITTDGLAALEAGLNTLAAVEGTLAQAFTPDDLADLSVLLAQASTALAPAPAPRSTPTAGA